MAAPSHHAAAGGDVDIARVAALFADPGRARILLALLDGRALPASVLAAAAGVSAPATSSHLAKLVDAGLVTVERSGRYRYHRLAGDDVGAALETLAALAGPARVTSLRAHTRAAALRHARSCYDHLAGAWGVAVAEGLLRHGAMRRADGVEGTARRLGDRLSSRLPDHPYELGPHARSVFGRLGVDVDAVAARPGRRPLLQVCTDWTEQRHHLGGRLGVALLDGLRDDGWVRDGTRPRTLEMTDVGRRGFLDVLGASVDRDPACGVGS